MGTTLQHGIFLPAEGERNCYTGLASNWTILDGVIGGYSSHAANLTIHVTAADKEAWNGKADASALTAHTGDTTIHVTAADKEAWNGKADSSALNAHTGDTTIHVTAEDKAKWDAVTGKANDANVVHKSGNETVAGAKTFSSNLTVYNSDTSAYASYLNLKNQKNVRGSTTDIGTQGLQFQDKNSKTLTMLESRVISNGNTGFNIICYNTDGNNQTVSDGVSVIKTPSGTNFAPTTDNAVTCGRASAKWSDVVTYKVNGVEPSSLALPSGNASDIIDISSYLSKLDGTDNTYVAPANGWITINMNNCTGIHATITGFWGDSRVRASAGAIKFLMPVIKNQTVTLTILGGTINNAQFIPCKGNI